MMYEDPTRYSLLFQTYVQLTMLERHNQPCDKDAKIMERSLLRIDICGHGLSHTMVEGACLLGT